MRRTIPRAARLLWPRLAIGRIITPTMRFRVLLDQFAGPLDLLLYLVRRHELDVLDIPLAQVTEQYLEILAALEQIDVDAVGDFLELATRLMEMKSRMMLPRQEENE